MSTAVRSFRPFVGARVVRGPDWNWDNQDGGEGHVGTLHKYKNSEEVVVVWDHGTVESYRYGSAHDLRILDSAPAGVKHDSVTCDECGEKPLYGIRWKCAECSNYDLCSMCYHGDEHYLQHKFHRIDLYKDNRTLVGPRKNCRKIPAFGLFDGARVTRGVHWEYGSQDGIIWKRGDITEIKEWSSSTPRSAARVTWNFGSNNVYRVGFEGKVDIKAIKKVAGYSFYHDHLPVLGTVVRSNSLAVGDRVKIELDAEAVQLLQLGHGGWADGMEEGLSNTGRIVEFDQDGDACVVYPSGNRWIFNPAALKRDDAETASESSFEVGDTVRISSDLKRVKALQRGHGDWVDAMRPTLGSIGEVKSVLPSGDLKIKVSGMSWVYNSECVSKGDAIMDDTSEYSYDTLPKLFESGTSEDPTQDMIEAAVKNNVQKIQTVLSNGNVQINDSLHGLTAILVASYYGSVEVVEFLIQNGVDLESQDKGGDRAIHNAAHRDEAKILELLVPAGADINSTNNRSQSALHIAVNECNTGIVRCLLELKANPSLQDSAGNTPLHEAITKEEHEIVQLLLKFAADISVKNSKGFNCLHHAALKGDVGAVRALLAAESLPLVINEKKEDGFTALHLASLNNHCMVAEILINQGKADKDSQNNALQTPLHLAVVRHHFQMVQLLVEEGSSLDIQDKVGDTPIHEAVQQHTILKLKQMKDAAANIALTLLGLRDPTVSSENSFSIACFLASNGADLTIRNKKGKTPLDLCHDPKLSKAISNRHGDHLSTIAYQESESADTVRMNGNARTINTIGSPWRMKTTGSRNAPRPTESTTTRKGRGPATASQETETDCILCYERRDILFKPCHHIALCSLCSERAKKCSICKEHIESKVQIEECFHCSDRKSDVLFKPCNHICTCSRCAKLMKKCSLCRTLIEQTIGYAELCGANSTSEHTASDGREQASIVKLGSCLLECRNGSLERKPNIELSELGIKNWMQRRHVPPCTNFNSISFSATAARLPVNVKKEEMMIFHLAPGDNRCHSQQLQQCYSRDSLILRSEREVVTKAGTTLEIYNTCIKLQVPEGALEDDAIVQLLILDPSTIPTVPTDLGEVVLSDIIKVGPDEIKFNVPAILSIPHSITEIPRHSSICINHFDSDTKQWAKLPRFSGLDELDANCGYIAKSGIYALCLLLDTECHVIPRTLTVIRPFNEEDSVSITFDDDTFEDDQTKVELKINTLTERMLDKFASAGIKPSIILHINAARNGQPKKPVSIEMPIPCGINQDEDIRIFKSDRGHDFTNVTESVSFQVSERHVVLRVEHFTNYWILGLPIEIPDITPFLSLFNPVYDVCFSVYIKAESIIRVGCCERHKEKEMSNKMKTDNYATVGFIEGKLQNGDKSNVAMHGRYQISGNEGRLQLNFKAKEINYTHPLHLEASQPSEELSSSLKNKVIIGMEMEGMREPVFVKFMIVDDQTMHVDYRESAMQKKESLPSEDKNREIGATKEPLLSKLKEDYNLVQYLECQLEGNSISNIKDLLRAFKLSFKDRCRILKCATQSLAFFENLSKSQPKLQLLEVRAFIQENSSHSHKQPNMAIFMKIEEDIAKGVVSFDLNSTLGELSGSPIDWLYILEEVAYNLAPMESALLKSWENVAGAAGYRASDIAALQRKNNEEGPLQKLLSLICAKDPSTPASLLVDKLREIGREDVVIDIEKWLVDVVKKRPALGET